MFCLKQDRMTRYQQQQKILKFSEKLDVIDNILEVWKDLGKNPIKIALASLSTVNKVIGLFSQMQEPVSFCDILKDSGYTRLFRKFTHFEGYLSRSLVESSEPRSHYDVAYDYTKFRVSIFNDVLACYAKDGADPGEFWIMPGKSEEEAFAILKKLVWNGSKELILSRIVDSDRRNDFQTTGLHDESDYVGDRNVDRIKDRLHKQPNAVKSIFLAGPSGVGKTSLAHLIAKEFAKDASILRIDTSIMRGGEMDELATIVKCFQPGTLLMDDIQYFLRNEDRYDKFLCFLEQMNVSSNTLVIATYMIDNLGDTFYIPGLRPGRFNEIVLLRSPDAEQRKLILSHYLKIAIDAESLESIAQETVGFTGAYLKELAARLNCFGVQAWSEELGYLKMVLPREVVLANKKLKAGESVEAISIPKSIDDGGDYDPDDDDEDDE